jgi:outer membrane protein
LSKLLQFVLAAGLAFAAAGAAAETKIGYVKMDKIMQSPDSIESGKRLQKEFSPRNEELGRFKKQIEDKETALDKEAAAMPENDRRKKYQELSDLKLEFQRKQRELSEDFVIRKNEERSKLQERINNAVTSVSKAEGYDLVLYGNAAYAGKKVDMTDKVLKALAK